MTARTDDVLTALRAEILAGTYAPRERLIEAELAQLLDTSRFIVRKALVQLHAEGLVDIQPNRGARVREISVDEAIALTQVRGAIEGLVASLAAEHASASDVEKLRGIGAAMRDAVTQLEVVSYSDLNASLHRTLREIAAHDPASRILDTLNAQIVQHQFLLALVPGRPAAALREHLDIIEAVAAGHPGAAEHAMRRHIANVITALESFREGGTAARTGIRELARKVRPVSRHDSPVLSPTATLVYGDQSRNQVLDLYLPAGHDRARRLPLVLLIHGGAFMMGDRTWELEALPKLLDAGFAAASVDYRLSSEARFPAAIRDVKAATAFLRAHADEYGIDPDFIAAWGRSAGGYLAAMLGATNDGTELFDEPGADARVAAVIDWYGPSDFRAMDDQFASGPPTGDGPPVQVHRTADSPESRFLGAAIDDVPELAEQANPLRYIRTASSLPPFFLATGTNDRLVPYQQTLLLADELRSRGAEVVLRVLQDASHADHVFEVQLAGPAIEWLRSLYASTPH